LEVHCDAAGGTHKGKSLLWILQNPFGLQIPCFTGGWSLRILCQALVISVPTFLFGREISHFIHSTINVYPRFHITFCKLSGLHRCLYNTIDGYSRRDVNAKAWQVAREANDSG
jgi:hypothetical protein